MVTLSLAHARDKRKLELSGVNGRTNPPEWILIHLELFDIGSVWVFYDANAKRELIIMHKLSDISSPNVNDPHTYCILLHDFRACITNYVISLMWHF